MVTRCKKTWWEDYWVPEWRQGRPFGRSWVSNGTLRVFFGQQEKSLQRSQRTRRHSTSQHACGQSTERSGGPGQGPCCVMPPLLPIGREADLTVTYVASSSHRVRNCGDTKMGETRLLSSRCFLCLWPLCLTRSTFLPFPEAPSHHSLLWLLPAPSPLKAILDQSSRCCA